MIIHIVFPSWEKNENVTTQDLEGNSFTNASTLDITLIVFALTKMMVVTFTAYHQCRHSLHHDGTMEQPFRHVVLPYSHRKTHNMKKM